MISGRYPLQAECPLLLRAVRRTFRFLARFHGSYRASATATTGHGWARPAAKSPASWDALHLTLFRDWPPSGSPPRRAQDRVPLTQYV